MRDDGCRKTDVGFWVKGWVLPRLSKSYFVIPMEKTVEFLKGLVLRKSYFVIQMTDASTGSAQVTDAG
jgi:hypothetical protein